MHNKNFIIGWWSAGITSAVACKYAIELYDNVKLYYIKIDTAHPDNERFKKDCEKWYGREIKVIQSNEFKDQFEVIRKVKAINTPTGAPCTKRLKKQLRFDLEKQYQVDLFNDVIILSQIWGYEFTKDEINRAIRHGQQYPDTNPLFPLIEKGITKDMCAGIVLNAGIQLPQMYRDGYTNNNCIGCVKGGMGYWNKIRVDYPEHFKKMAEIEREIGYTCLYNEKEGKIYLDTLNPSRGNMKKEVMPSCGNICDVEFVDILDKNLDEVIEKNMTIYDAIKNNS
jgi:hypothetical protein